jgi:hypothetical protein
VTRRRDREYDRQYILTEAGDRERDPTETDNRWDDEAYADVRADLLVWLSDRMAGLSIRCRPRRARGECTGPVLPAPAPRAPRDRRDRIAGVPADYSSVG